MLLLSGDGYTLRLRYAAEFIFSHWGNIGEWKWVSKEDAAFTDGEIKIYYGEQAPEGWVEIRPSTIIKEGFKDKVNLGIFHQEGDILAFPVPGKVGFDPFALAFWFITRYEEYGESQADAHGRFPYEASAFASFGLDEKPLLDAALHHFFKKMGLTPHRTFHNEPTLDIDMAFKFFGKPRWRLWSGLLYQGISNDVKIFGEWREAKTPALDPFNNFDYQEQIFTEWGILPWYFFHVGDYGKYDKSISLEQPLMQGILHQCQRFGKIGLHPSYHTLDAEGLLEKEKAELELYLGESVLASRQHYLRFKLPLSYRRLIEQKITDDYSMGFADSTGFRAGTSTPFYFYDLDKEEEAPLLIHPFCAMDVVLKNRLQLSVAGGISKMTRIQQEIKRYGGVFSYIFHNESLSETSGWKGWRKVFEHCLAC